MKNATTGEIPDAMSNLTWSPAEKKIAREAFDKALQQELQDVVQQTKQRAAGIAQSSDVWDLETFLTQRRKEIDREYDYRYAVLPDVFARLILKGRMDEKDLEGLCSDKIEHIQRRLSFARHSWPIQQLNMGRVSSYRCRYIVTGNRNSSIGPTRSAHAASSCTASAASK